jgi:hypothetical protein
MKTQKLKTIAILLISILITSCSNNDDCTVGSGTIVTETISINTFSGIITSGLDNVNITQSDVQEVTVTGYQNIINRVKRSVNNGIWNIELEDGCYKNSDLAFDIKVPNMNLLQLEGSGNIVLNDFINQGPLSLNIEGSGNIDLYANQGTELLDIVISGTGKVQGFSNFENLENLNIEIYGAGTCNLFPIETNNCRIDIEGSSVCNVFVNDYLDVDIEGSGTINYKGYPTINQSINGSGSINDAN